MTEEEAHRFLGGLEAAFEVKMPESRRQIYVDALKKLDGAASREAFGRLVWTARRFPLVAEIVHAFKAVTEPTQTRDVSRSLPPSAETRRRQEEALRRYLELEPVMYHRDLYWAYVDAMREHRAGLRTKEELERLRYTLIRQARDRNRPVKSESADGPQVVAVAEEDESPF